MATSSQTGPAQRLSLEDKPDASQTDVPSWVSEWRDCSLGTITRWEANLLAKFLGGSQWKWGRKGRSCSSAALLGESFFPSSYSRIKTRNDAFSLPSSTSTLVLVVLLIVAAGKMTEQGRREGGGREGVEALCVFTVHLIEN